MDFSKHKDLWDKVINGSNAEAVAAATTLYELGEMSEFLFKTTIFGICSAIKEKKKQSKEENK